MGTNDTAAEGGGTDDGPVQVIIELRVPNGERAASLDMASGFDVGGFELDEEYDPVPMEASAEMALAADEEVVAVRGRVPADQIEALEAQDNVVSVTRDASIEPFAVESPAQPELGPVYPDFDALSSPPIRDQHAELSLAAEAADTCPISPCDCQSRTPKGDISDVRSFLGVDTIWQRGYKGRGVVVGVVDGGVEAKSRTNGPIPRVVDGWPQNDWGTVARWGEHGNMCATDVLGMAPEAQLHDIRIADARTGGVISDALAGFQWAIQQHRRTGRPHILSNSWGIFDKRSAPDYATEIDHPFTRKVAQAINEGITVLFAAGNCGSTCPDSRCATSGPGESIWGANGHPQVITVGAVNTNDEFIGYSSQGPASLDPHKPDFLSASHFTGYFRSDSGTSAATPVAAGVTALLEQADRSMSPEELKSTLKWTSRDFGPSGWDQHSGRGVLQADRALDHVIGVSQRDRVYPYELRITGTQFENTIKPGETQRWFTHSWPSEYIAQWSIRPTSPEGRLDWSVDVKREQDGDLTYFLTIENVSNVTTGFEAKYVLTR
jgi:subtilisin family serine protease